MAPYLLVTKSSPPRGELRKGRPKRQVGKTVQNRRFSWLLGGRRKESRIKSKSPREEMDGNKICTPREKKPIERNPYGHLAPIFLELGAEIPKEVRSKEVKYVI